MVNLYSILGVSESASQQDIKHAYRRLAVKYHPDSSGDQSSSKEFIKINKAYQVLSVPARRIWYDHRLNQLRQQAYHRGRRPYYNKSVKYDTEAIRKAKAEWAARYRHYLNRRKVENNGPLWKRKDFRIAIFSLLILMLVVLFFNNVRYMMLKRHDATTVGVVISPYSFNYDSRNLHYSYSVNDSIYRKHEARPTSPTVDRIITDSGVPVRKGDKFMVWYNPEHPQRGFIDLKYPEQSTILKIRERAIQMLKRQTSFSTDKAACIVNELYKRKGLEGLGVILCSEMKWYENLTSNKNNFQKLIKSDLWKDITKEACSQTSLQNK